MVYDSENVISGSIIIKGNCIKRICFLFLIIFVFPILTYAQNIDKSIYQEISLKDAYKNRETTSEEVYYYKSMVHFEQIYYNSIMGHINALFYQNTEFINLYYYNNDFPEIKRFLIVNIYYRFVREGTAFRNVLDHVEFIKAPYFIIGDHYRTLDNLRLRSEGNRSGNIISTIQKGEWVIVLKEGNEETIGGITSVWVNVKLVNGNREGWCFGGYLGYYDR
jgi:uncharacterized protein YgiM (DUF1202 family)